jgi:hypothetical protein
MRRRIHGLYEEEDTSHEASYLPAPRGLALSLIQYEVKRIVPVVVALGVDR